MVGNSLAVEFISLIDVRESSEAHPQASGSPAPATKDERYDHTEEFVAIMQRAWAQTSRWSHEGRNCKSDDFVAGYRPVHDSYETVAAAILDYVDIRASRVSIRGCDNLNDAIEHGQRVLPLVRQELAHRAATSPSTQQAS